MIIDRADVLEADRGEPLQTFGARAVETAQRVTDVGPAGKSWSYIDLALRAESIPLNRVGQGMPTPTN